MNYYVPSPKALNLDLADEEVLKRIKLLLDFSYFDPKWYFDKYKDVQKQIVCKDEIIRSHFIKTGYWEGRLPFFFEIDKVFLNKYYSSALINSKMKRMVCYKVGALTSRIHFDLSFYNMHFNHKGNHFENEEQAFVHFLKIGYVKLNLPYDIQGKI